MQQIDLSKIIDTIQSTPFYNLNSTHSGGQAARKFLLNEKKRIKDLLNLTETQIVVFTRSYVEAVAISVGIRNSHIFCSSERIHNLLKKTETIFCLGWLIDLKKGNGHEDTFEIWDGGKSVRRIWIPQLFNMNTKDYNRLITEYTVVLGPRSVGARYGACVINPPDEQIFPGAVYEKGYVAGTPSLWMIKHFTEALYLHLDSVHTNP